MQLVPRKQKKKTSNKILTEWGGYFQTLVPRSIPNAVESVEPIPNPALPCHDSTKRWVKDNFKRTDYALSHAVYYKQFVAFGYRQKKFAYYFLPHQWFKNSPGTARGFLAVLLTLEFNLGDSAGDWCSGAIVNATSLHQPKRPSLQRWCKSKKFEEVRFFAWFCFFLNLLPNLSIKPWKNVSRWWSEASCSAKKTIPCPIVRDCRHWSHSE